MSDRMLKVSYIDLSGKTQETLISKRNQGKELAQLRDKGFTIRDITKSW